MTVFANENGKLADEQFEELKHAGKKGKEQKNVSFESSAVFYNCSYNNICHYCVIISRICSDT